MKHNPIQTEHYLEITDANIKERTATRLKELVDLGLTESGTASFGLQNVMDGLYIERVWSYDDEAWRGYVDWIKKLAAEKAPLIKKAKREAFHMLRTQRDNGVDVFRGTYEYRFDRLLLRCSRTMYGDFCVYYSTGHIGSPGYKFYITDDEL